MALTKIGAYEIERRIATGGMAEVYLAKRKGPYGFAKRVALKQILPQYAQDNEFVSLFIEEARTAARLEHPSIVQVFDFGEEQGHLYLAMEFVDGVDAARLALHADPGDELQIGSWHVSGPSTTWWCSRR